ncbi:hypothetical protein [Bacillus velezensis]|uniref:hypothetical protein n=1 Tax=Bacillus velezensis TaxID=492670 RepID=UPI001E295430|nr:hypothetical protein [Bacillus velezensis]
MNSRGMIGYASERLVESDLLFQGIVVLNPSQPDLEYDLVAQIGNEISKYRLKGKER